MNKTNNMKNEVVKTFVVGLAKKNLKLENALEEMLTKNHLDIKYSEKLPCTIRQKKVYSS